ncbi:MAG: hypothetical protein R3B93_16885, partial [Bacteroidia bacterium]
MAIDDINIFEPSDYDVLAGPVVSPVTSCGLTATETICAEIVNFGLDTLDNIIASFSIDGGAFTTPETVPGILLPGDTMTYCFTTAGDLSGYGLHDITVVTTQLTPADTVNYNDTSVTQITHYTAYTGTFPYFQNFDGPGFVPDNTSFGPGNPVITLAEGWVNSQADGAQDWAVRSVATGSFQTGPDFDHTTGSTNFIFADDDFDEDSVILISPCFDVSGLNNPKMTFWYHSNNNNNPNNENFLHIDLIQGSDIILDIIPALGHKDPNWNLVEIDMSFFPTSWAVRFRVNTNNAWFAHDIAIDDFGIIDVLPQDAGITDILTPVSGCGLTANEDLTLALGNLGTDSILNGVTVNYQISLNGTPGAINSLPSPQDTILPGVILPVIITNQDFSVPGTYTVTAWTSGLAGDTNFFNDTFSIEIINIPVVSSYPYSQDFENGNGGWVVEDYAGNSTWELSTPANTVINSAASGVNSWITNATGQYNNNEDAAVISPCFDFSALAVPVIEFAIWWECEDPWDGAVLQSSIDNGLTWVTVGNFGDPDNWYNNAGIISQPGGQGQGWTGDFGVGSNGWVIAKHGLDSLGGQSNVRLRVAYSSDGSVQGNGFAFDDIFIYETPDTDVGVANFVQPPGSTCSSDSTEIEITLINFGLLPQTNIPVTVNITGAASSMITNVYTDTLQPGDSVTFIVGTFNSNIGGTFNLSGYSVQAGDTLGFNDSTFLTTLVTTSALAPSVMGDSTCLDSTSFMLMASSAAAANIWYDSIGGAPIYIGDTLTTPVLNQTTTYYVQAANFTGDSITTTYAAGNGQSGNMFDVTAIAGELTIDSFDVHAPVTTQITVEVYYKVGSYVGFEANAAAWTLLGSQVVTGAGANNPTRVPVGGLTIPAGQTFGLYVTTTASTLSYSNFASVYNDGNIEVETGVGVAYPFAGTFSPRTWNGSIYYTSLGCPSPLV